MKITPAHTRRSFVRLSALGFAGLALAFTACNSAGSENATSDRAATDEQAGSAATTTIYVGTYAKADDESIFIYTLDEATGELKRANALKAGENPSYLALDAQRRYLYAVAEAENASGTPGGAVSAFSIDQGTGSLVFLNKVSALGDGPCHVSVDEEHNAVLVANYGSGTVAALPIQENGNLGEAAGMVAHEGASMANKNRQEKPHAHYIAPDPNNKFIFSVDLGADKIFGYQIGSDGKLTPNGAAAVAFTSKPGAGPRHMTFHPNGRYAYVINELNSTMTALAYDSNKGSFTEIESVTTIPADFTQNNQCAAVKVSPDGKFLYGSNRGHNSIVAYAIDEATGKLTLVQHMETGGDWPRDFMISSSGDVLLVANERSNNIVSFKIDKATGELAKTGQQVKVKNPVCLVER